ncbi:MAG TPA: CHAD domain-containing protein [Myxococcota bacterium]|nr:CHAD domain-containing protein [Myxococcota bacterium]
MPDAAAREIELKLELSPSDAARILDHPLVHRHAVGPAQSRQLLSVYFDTRELGLAKAGIGLRLRHTGDEQVQTVKWGEGAAAGLFERGELEVAVSGQRPVLYAIPDEALRERIREALRGEPLEPIFETEMRRTHCLLRDGADEWSLDLDEGEIRAQDASLPFCELELELVRGDPARLYELALELCESFELRVGLRSKAERGYALRSGSGPVPRKAREVELPDGATLDTALRDIARACLGQIGVNLEPAFEGTDPEGVHQMRVGVRRMRSVFSVFRPVLPDDRTRALRDELRWLASELGEVRDLDVFVGELLGPLAGPRGDDVALKRLRVEAEELRDERRRSLRETLYSRRLTRLLLSLGHWIARSSWREQALSETSALLFQPARSFSDSLLERLHQRVGKLGRAAVTGPPPARHELRIALKKLRYACEFFGSLYEGRDARRYLRRLSRLQDVLGALNDVATAGRVLQELLGRVGPPDADSLARTVGFIEGFAAREDELSLRELATLWKRFARTHPFWEHD